jgi:hypothetical protein
VRDKKLMTALFDPLQIAKKTAKAVGRGDHRKYYLKTLKWKNSFFMVT